jgi:hypothetical protein
MTGEDGLAESGWFKACFLDRMFTVSFRNAAPVKSLEWPLLTQETASDFQADVLL